MTTSLAAPERPSLAVLRERIRVLERRPASPRSDRETPVVTSGCALARLLSVAGERTGTLVEWLTPRGSGSWQAILLSLPAQCRKRGPVVVVDNRREFCPNGWSALGFDLDRTLVVRPATRSDALWAWEQSLRCSGVAIVLGALDDFDSRVGRRLQLAAEAGGTLGLIARPLSARKSICWADFRCEFRPQPGSGPEGRRGRLTVLRTRSGLAEPITWDTGTDSAEQDAA